MTRETTGGRFTCPRNSVMDQAGPQGSYFSELGDQIADGANAAGVWEDMPRDDRSHERAPTGERPTEGAVPQTASSAGEAPMPSMLGANGAISQVRWWLVACS